MPDCIPIQKNGYKRINRVPTYIQIPTNVLSDERLSQTQKLMYGIMYTITQMEGMCIAAQYDFQKMLNIGHQSASNAVTKLNRLGYIRFETRTAGRQGCTRYIYVL